jgi:hypothetical protein
MLSLIISPTILEKLETKHKVTRREVEQCFENLAGNYLEDTNEDHATDPPTLWFIAPTNRGRQLKVVFVFKDGNIYVKSAFAPSAKSVALYESKGK